MFWLVVGITNSNIPQGSTILFPSLFYLSYKKVSTLIGGLYSQENLARALELLLPLNLLLITCFLYFNLFRDLMEAWLVYAISTNCDVEALFNMTQWKFQWFCLDSLVITSPPHWIEIICTLPSPLCVGHLTLS